MDKAISKFFPALVIAGLLLPLLALGYVGQYSRYMADDYCWAAMVTEQGLSGALATWYATWEGRYTHMMIKGVIALLGVSAVPIFPTLILLSWMLATAWSCYQLLLIVRFPQPKMSALLAAGLLLFATFNGTPSRIQSLFWPSGSVPYTGGLVLFTFLIGFIVHRLRQHPEQPPYGAVVIVGVITFIAAGLSETYVVFQTAALGLLLLAVLAFAPPVYRRSAFLLLGAGIICSLAGLLLMAGAPGNAVRRAQFPPMPLLAAVGRTFVTALAYPLIAAQRFSTIALPVAVLLPMLYVYRLEPLPTHLRLSGRRARRMLFGVAAVSLILIMACLLPPIYATSFAPASRAYILPQFILIAAAAACGSIMGLGARWQQPRLNPLMHQIIGVVIVVLVVIGPVMAAWQTLADAPDFRVYAAEWDERDAAIRAAAARGEQRVETMMLTVDISARTGLDTIGPDADQGTNVCAAQYYGITTLIAQTSLTMGNKTTR